VLQESVRAVHARITMITARVEDDYCVHRTRSVPPLGIFLTPVRKNVAPDLQADARSLTRIGRLTLQ